jgi:AcrR family transcriptional regulator
MKALDPDYLREQCDRLLWPEEDPRQRVKRERILKAATDLFVRQGYRKTSVAEVAEAACVAKGTVYLYYSNKAELVFSAVILEKRDHLERLMPFAEMTMTPRQQLRAMIKQGLLMSRDMPLTTSLLQGDQEIRLALAEQDAEQIADATRVQLDLLRQLIAAADPDLSTKDTDARCRLLLDLMWAIVTSPMQNTGDLPPEQYAEQVADALVAGALAASELPLPPTGIQHTVTEVKP